MFSRGCEGDEQHWTVRYRVRLILSECYLSDLSLWLGVQLRNSRFYAYLFMKVFETRVKFLEHPRFCTVINCAFNFYTTNVFVCFRYVIAQFEQAKHKCPRQIIPCTFICAAFKSHREGTNAQRVIVPTTTNQQTTADTYLGLNRLRLRDTHKLR